MVVSGAHDAFCRGRADRVARSVDDWCNPYHLSFNALNQVGGIAGMIAGITVPVDGGWTAQ